MSEKYSTNIKVKVRFDAPPRNIVCCSASNVVDIFLPYCKYCMHYDTKYLCFFPSGEASASWRNISCPGRSARSRGRRKCPLEIGLHRRIKGKKGLRYITGIEMMIKDSDINEK